MNPLSLFTQLRSHVGSYAGILGKRFLSLIWLGAVCALIWFYGPKVPWGDDRPLEPARVRLIIIGVILTLWLIWSLISLIRARRRDKAMIEDVAESPEARAGRESAEEVAQLRERLKEAMKLLKKTVKRRFGFAYEFPWYILIGAPGAGKTTLLLNSGLKFPLGDAMGVEPLKGVGGTRNCNWWFTDQAIMIDTAGRYTTQESYQERDKAGWLGFLKLLRQHRPSQPINGVLITFSLTDLLTQSPEDRLRETRAIRQRLSELEEGLKARIPVYLVLTKADRLVGFMQFFDGLGKSEREQVWGMTFALEESRDHTGLPEVFEREFDALLDRLNGILLERLQQEPDLDRRGNIFRFPAQVAALRESLREIIEEISSGTAYVAAPLIRGVYLASATQEEAVSARPLAATMNRSYFLTRLLGETVFREAALVTQDRRLTRRQRVTRSLAYTSVVALSLALAGGWGVSFFNNDRAIAATNEALEEYQPLAAGISVREVRDADFLRILPALNTLSSAADSFREEKLRGFGFDQAPKVEDRHKRSYENALNGLLLPRLLVVLQNDMRVEDAQPNPLFNALKLYLSLSGQEGLIDPEEAQNYFFARLEELYPGARRQGARDDLMQHVSVLVSSRDVAQMEIDTYLVAETRKLIRDLQPALRAYTMLREHTDAVALPEWRASTTLGPAAAQTFTRASDASLRDGVPGLYTQRGYQNVVLPRLRELAEKAAGEQWVQGPDARSNITPTTIAQDAAQLYFSDFGEKWQTLTSDLRIAPQESIAAAADLMTVIASDARPIERMAVAITKATHLTGVAIDNPQGAENLADTTLPIDPLAAPDPFGTLREALSSPEDSEEISDIAALQPLLDQVYQQLFRASASDARVSEVFSAQSRLTEVNEELLSAGRRMPSPVDQWVVGLSSNIARVAVLSARQSVSEIWAANGAQECRRAIEGRYPFDPGSSTDVTMGDFTRIFGPDGLFNTFFDDNLADFVDVGQENWAWKGGLGTTGESTRSLAQFQRAAQIRDAFFPSGSARPKVTLDFKLEQMSENAISSIVLVNGQRSLHGFENVTPRSLIWPGEDTLQESRLLIRPGDFNESLTTKGVWSPFRLIDTGRSEIISENTFRVTLSSTDHTAVFTVTTNSVNNPFQLEAIDAFSCPPDL